MQPSIFDGTKLFCRLFGSDYNFRYQKIGPDAFRHEVKRAIETMEEPPERIYTGQQSHDNHVVYCDESRGNAYVIGRTYDETDGLLTDQAGSLMIVKFADCTPVVLFDPKQEVAAVVHSGWRGTAARISEVAVKRMVDDFHCQPADILAYVGPSIDQDHYEVGAEVYEAFERFSQRENFFQPAGDRYHLSMIEANRSILIDAGLSADHIEVCQTSTYTSPELNSARRQGEDYRLNAIFVMIKER